MFGEKHLYSLYKGVPLGKWHYIIATASVMILISLNNLQLSTTMITFSGREKSCEGQKTCILRLKWHYQIIITGTVRMTKYIQFYIFIYILFRVLSTTIPFQGIEKSSEDQKSNKRLLNGIITFGFLSFLYFKNKLSASSISCLRYFEFRNAMDITIVDCWMNFVKVWKMPSDNSLFAISRISNCFKYMLQRDAYRNRLRKAIDHILI